jgi:hypothetical protein
MDTHVAQVQRIGAVIPPEDPRHEIAHVKSERRGTVVVLVNRDFYLPKRDVSSIAWEYA